MRAWIFAAVLAAVVASGDHGRAEVIGSDNRFSMESFAAQNNMDVAQLRRTYAASGRIMCPFGESSAFLVHKNNIVVTARHAVFPPSGTNGYPRVTPINRCGFEVTDGHESKWYRVDVGSFRYLDEPILTRENRFDWVVMKLLDPVPDAIPYKLPDSGAFPEAGTLVSVITIRQSGHRAQDWNARLLARCTFLDSVTIDGIANSGLKTDCSAYIGSSGGAVVQDTPDGPVALGIVVTDTRGAYRCPGYDSATCYTYATGLSDVVQAAIRSMADD